MQKPPTPESKSISNRDPSVGPASLKDPSSSLNTTVSQRSHERQRPEAPHRCRGRRARAQRGGTGAAPLAAESLQLFSNPHSRNAFLRMTWARTHTHTHMIWRRTHYGTCLCACMYRIPVYIPFEFRDYRTLQAAINNSPESDAGPGHRLCKVSPLPCAPAVLCLSRASGTTS